MLCSFNYCVWSYDIIDKTYEELIEPSFMAKMLSVETRYYVPNPFALKVMSTTILAIL